VRNKALAIQQKGESKEVMTTKELADFLKTSSKVILENARKCMPKKVIENGKPTYWNKIEVTVLLDYLKNNPQTNSSHLYLQSKGYETELTPALKIKKALELMQEGYEEELRRLEAEKQFLSIKLDEAEDWYSIKRMQKLNPDVNFNWRLMKRESEKLGHEVKKVFDQNYGEVNAYHRDVYESLYFDTLEY
jgi:hypothetical protein